MQRFALLLLLLGLPLGSLCLLPLRVRARAPGECLLQIALELSDLTLELGIVSFYFTYDGVRPLGRQSFDARCRPRHADRRHPEHGAVATREFSESASSFFRTVNSKSVSIPTTSHDPASTQAQARGSDAGA
eukprot:scaffold33523_cov112-Isochrysis_galbana.AAC.15